MQIFDTPASSLKPEPSDPSFPTANGLHASLPGETDRKWMHRTLWSYLQIVVAIVVDHGFDLQLLVPRHRVRQPQVHKETLPRPRIVRLGNTEPCTYDRLILKTILGGFCCSWMVLFVIQSFIRGIGVYPSPLPVLGEALMARMPHSVILSGSALFIVRDANLWMTTTPLCEGSLTVNFVSKL